MHQGVRRNWVRTRALSLFTRVLLDKLLNLSQPLSLSSKRDNNSAHFIRLGELIERKSSDNDISCCYVQVYIIKLYYLPPSAGISSGLGLNLFWDGWMRVWENLIYL